MHRQKCLCIGLHPKCTENLRLHPKFTMRASGLVWSAVFLSCAAPVVERTAKTFFLCPWWSVLWKPSSFAAPVVERPAETFVFLSGMPS